MSVCCMLSPPQNHASRRIGNIGKLEDGKIFGRFGCFFGFEIYIYIFFLSLQTSLRFIVGKGSLAVGFSDR